MAVFCGNCKNVILCKKFLRRWEWCDNPLARCSEGHADTEAYCKKCYEDLKSESDTLKYNYDRESKEARNKYANLENAIVQKAALQEDVAFLRNWSFVPGEPSSSSDVTLCTLDGSIFYAHLLLLTNRSDVFRAMFEVDLVEKRSGNVLIKDVGGESLKLFLKFLYSAQVSDEEIHGNYKELVKLAHLYQVNLLLQKLDMFIVEHVLKKENAIELLKMVHLYELEKTKEGVHKMIRNDSQMLNMLTKEMVRIL
ncbi:hypothetical protein KI387_039579 [Taxus chinensis]|uniref:BTB domain-containing protein n=1 Tax=Taxus chinensis TaxID=29808 RepID=A0AA38FC55_TAXCH|nr:hypothetical protein KI387_039579 [Taxus chinensis]